MIARWVVRGLIQRRYPVGSSILAMALALAFLLSCVKLNSMIVDGVPRGTTLPKGSFTVFQHDPNARLSFFLSPAQIARLQHNLEGSAAVIGASGVRALKFGLPSEAAPTSTIQVDFVSPEFFLTLGVHFLAGDAGRFATTEDGVVLSERFVSSLGLSDPPSSIVVEGRRLQVTGVVRGFNGLFDRNCYAWIHWRQAEGLLFPDLPGKKSLDVADQPWFYWTLVTPTQGTSDSVGAILRSPELVGAIVERPFSELKVIDGISNQLDLRRSASKGQEIYWRLAVLLVAVACMALALTVAMVRMSRLHNELVKLQLGLPRSALTRILAHYAFWPTLFAVAIGMAASYFVDALLAREPSIAAYTELSAELSTGFPWRATVLTFMVVLGACGALQYVLVRSAGLRFGVRTLDARQRSMSRLFAYFEIALVAVAASAVTLGTAAAASSVIQLRAIAEAERSATWAVTFRLADDSTLAPASQRTFLDRLHAEGYQGGFLTVLPLSEPRRSPTSFQFASGTLTVLENAATPEVFGARRLALLAGRPFEAGNINEIVIDETAAHIIQKAIAPQSILGSTITNTSGESYVVVGIVESITYSTDPDYRLPVVYSSLGTISRRGAILLFGAGAPNRLRAALEEAGGSISDFFVDRVETLVDRGRRVGARHRAKAALTAAAAAVSALVAFLLVASVSAMRAKLSAKDRAVRVAVGGDPVRLTADAALSGGSRLLAGTLIGFMAIWSTPLATTADLTLSEVRATSVMALFGFLLIGLLLTSMLAHRMVRRTDVIALLRSD